MTRWFLTRDTHDSEKKGRVLKTEVWAHRLGFREYAHTPSRLWSYS
jgi:hypothetical protein